MMYKFGVSGKLNLSTELPLLNLVYSFTQTFLKYFLIAMNQTYAPSHSPTPPTRFFPRQVKDIEQFNKMVNISCPGQIFVI